MLGVQVAIAALVLTTASCAAKESSQSVLKVQVNDTSGAFVSDAKIQLCSKELKVPLETRANNAGEGIINIDPGTYSMSVESRGFKVWSEIVQVEPGQTRTIHVRLEVGGGGGVEIQPTDELEFEHLMPDEAIADIPFTSIELPAHRLRLSHRRAL